MTALALANLTLRAGRATLLDDVSLECPAGEITLLIGPNGAGKSSALGCLAGDRLPSAGDALLDGVPLRLLGAAERARRRAVVLQHFAIDFPLAAHEIVALGLLPWGETGTRHAAEHVARALGAVDATALAGRDVRTLSGGERQRVEIARALCQAGCATGAPPYLLLDEPTASLDLKHAARLVARLRGLADAGHGVVLVMHDIALGLPVADRVVVLTAGRVAFAGAAASLEAELLAAAFEVPLGMATRLLAA